MNKKHIVLFNNGNIADLVNVANELFSLINKIKNYEFKVNNNEIYYTKDNKSILIVVLNNVVIIDFHEINDFSIISKLFESIQKTYFKYKIEFIRIGYAIEKKISKSNVDKFKKNVLLNTEIINSIGIELSWYNLITINDIEVNCWKRYINSQSNGEMNIIFDINTKETEEIIINEVFFSSFIKSSTEYIESEYMKPIE